MKKIVLVIILVYMLYPSIYAQEGGIRKHSVAVFEIIDSTFAGIVDDFISKAKRDYSLDTVEFNIDIFQFRDVIYVNLCLWEQNKADKDIVMYRHPDCQTLIKHQNILFRTYVSRDSGAYLYNRLTSSLRPMPHRQNIYIKEPPLNFYSKNNKGGDRHLILRSEYEYKDNQWDRGNLMLE